VLERALTERQVWCDNITTPETETCQSILKAAFEAAVLEVETADEPTWGAIHQVNFRHMGFGRLPVIGSLFNVRIPSPGGQETVNRAAMRFSSNTDPYGQGHGPSLRALYNLADLNKSRFMIGPGQSGRLFSDNRSNLAEKWRDGAYLTLGPLSTPSHVLTLKPEQP
jgi:penicillin amidase